MSEIVELIGLVLPTRDGEDTRLEAALGAMVVEQHRELVLLMHKLRFRLVGQPPLRAAFACLACAELMMMELPEPIDESEFARLRGFAITLAERIAQAPT